MTVPSAVPQHAGRRSRFGLWMGAVGPRLMMRRGERPAVVVCAWCESNGLAHGAARHPGSSEWWAVSHDYVRGAKRDGRTSHGICPMCRSRAVEEWGLR